jgi:hypothetical protein
LEFDEYSNDSSHIMSTLGLGLYPVNRWSISSWDKSINRI